MPIFEFRCQVCGHQFEAYVRSQDPPPTSCPACSADRIERQLSMFATSSREQRQASAAKQVASAAGHGRAETAAQDRDADAHRKEDH